MDEKRLVDIETKLAFQEDTIKQLNDVVYEQQKQFDQLDKLCKHIIKQLREGDENELDVIDQKPPHY